MSLEARLDWPSLLRCSLTCEKRSWLCAEESLLDVSLEEGMDRMDLDDLHHEHSKRARTTNPSISDLRLAVDAAAEMQVCAECVLVRIRDSSGRAEICVDLWYSESGSKGSPACEAQERVMAPLWA